MVHIRRSNLCFGVKNIILTPVHLLALLCELFKNAQTWITLRYIFHCHISIHSVNIVNKIDAVLITYTYSLQNILQFTAPIKQVFPEIVLIYLQKKGRTPPPQQQQQISRNYLLLFNLHMHFWINVLFAFELSSCTWCDQIVSGLTARCLSLFQHIFLLLGVNTVVCWIIACSE